MMRGGCKIAVFALLGALAMVGRSEAGLIPTNVSITPDGGNFRWTYAVVVTTDVKVNPGDYFTIYDFGGMISGTAVAPAGWTFSTGKSGPTPAGTAPHDDPAIDNVTFTYSVHIGVANSGEWPHRSGYHFHRCAGAGRQPQHHAGAGHPGHVRLQPARAGFAAFFAQSPQETDALIER
jgi:hypothetical protein